MKMDTLKPQKVKTRKTKVVTRRSTAQMLSSLFFRAIEISVVVVTVAKLFYQLVVTFENSEEHFRGLAAVLANRHFVFVVGNAIVIGLLAKSGQFPSQESEARSAGNGFYEEFVRESRREERNSSCAETKNRAKQSITESNGTTTTTEISTKQSATAKEGVTEDKVKQSTTETRQRHVRSEKSRPKESVVEIESAAEVKGKQSITENRPRQNTGENMAKQSKGYVRSWSENPKISPRGNLRRSETERSLNRFDSVEETRDLNDRMSNDELRFKIESFIARQKRNQKDEEFCIT